MAPLVKPAASATSSRLPSSTPRSENTRRPASRSSTRVSLFRLARMIPMGIQDTDENRNQPAGRPFWGAAPSASTAHGGRRPPPRKDEHRERRARRRGGLVSAGRMQRRNAAP